ELAGYVAEVIGDEIAQQREAVRAWLAQSEASGSLPQLGPPSSSVSAGAMAMPDMHSGIATSPDYGANKRRRWRSVALGLLLSCGAAAGGFYWSQSTQLDGGAGAKASAAAPVMGAEQQQAAPESPSVEAGSASSAALASSAKGDEPQKIS